MIRVLIVLLVLLTACPSWAAITYVGGQTGSFPGQTANLNVTFALTGGSNATPQAGDLVIATLCLSSTGDATMQIQGDGAVNYTLLGTEGFVSDLYDINRNTAYRVMPGTPDTQVQLDNGTGGIADAIAYDIHVYRGVHATPLEQAVVQASNINTSAVNPTSITPTTTGTVIHVVGCGALATTRQGVYTSSDLTAFLSSAQDDTNAVNIGAGYFAWTSGAFDAAQFGAGGTDNAEHSSSYMVVPLAPAEVASSAGSACGAALLLGVGGC